MKIMKIIKHGLTHSIKQKETRKDPVRDLWDKDFRSPKKPVGFKNSKRK
jgi:hypothetical protein